MAFDLGTIKDPEALQAIEPSITQTTPGEVLGATAGAAFDSLPTVRGMGATARSFADGLPISQGEGSFVSTDSMGLPPAPIMQPDEANKKAKAAGVDVSFDKPLSADSAQSIIDDHLTAQQRADVISRNGNSVLSGQVGRFVTGSLISLADPINLAAMMIPAAPEAFVAEKLAAAAGVFERGAIRGAAGAVNGAVGMAALEPLNYTMSKSDYNDWSAGDALRNIFMGAALGAGGHMLLGGLAGREHLTPAEANTSMEATRAAIGQVADGRPVDVDGVVKVRELQAQAADLQAHAAPVAAEGIDAFHGTPHEFDSFHTANIGTGEGAQSFGHGLYFAENEGIADGYRKVLSRQHMSPEYEAAELDLNSAIKTSNAAYKEFRDKGLTGDALEQRMAEYREHIDNMQAKLDAMPAPDGNLYQVKLNAKPGELLDLDKSLSAQPEVMAKLEAAGIDTNGGAMTGKELHDVLAAEYRGAHPTYGNEGAPAQFAAEQLQKAGIKGNRYLDGNSRDGAGSSNNFVMFDHKDVQITHKNGVPVAQAAADLRAQADTAAKGMADRAMNPPADPVTTQAARINQATIDNAPKIEGNADKDVAEVTKRVQEKTQQYQREVASGRIIETQEMKDAMTEADHIENEGKASAGYAACLVGKGLK